MYAQWKSNTYTVNYNANGGKGAPSSQTKKHGENLTLSSTQPTKTGYNFKGWGISSTDTTVDYAPGTTYTESKSITLYAIWKQIYIITFDPNGGTVNKTKKEREYGWYYGELPTPILKNHTFVGWYTAKNGGDKKTSESVTYGDITLYAHWTANCNPTPHKWCTCNFPYFYEITSADGTIIEKCCNSQNLDPLSINSATCANVVKQ